MMIKKRAKRKLKILPDDLLSSIFVRAKELSAEVEAKYG